jgi:hypothetical protein
MNDIVNDFAELFSVAVSDEALSRPTVEVLALMTAVVFATKDEAFDIDEYMTACVGY